jgi:hypothetical protein
MKVLPSHNVTACAICKHVRECSYKFRMSSSTSTTTPTATAPARVVSALEQHVADAATLSKDALLSGGWWYPFHGIFYFVSHASLYRSILPVIFKMLLTGIGITAALFVFTYLPQVAFCAVFSGPFAFATAALLVLGEAYALILFVSKARRL